MTYTQGIEKKIPNLKTLLGINIVAKSINLVINII
jgi:hypothetical protein